MEIPMEVFVRIFPDTIEKNQSDNIKIELLTENNEKSEIKIDEKLFNVKKLLKENCTQMDVYTEAVKPLISSFMAGYDASVVLYGQKHTGKTYTLYGPGPNCVYDDSTQGIIQRSVREIFSILENQNERQYMLNMGWLELCGTKVHDILEGMIPLNSMADAFHWLRIGQLNRSSPNSHVSLALILEQKWITNDGYIQHILSTFSFCDIAATGPNNLLKEPEINEITNNGLECLKQIVTELVDSTELFKTNIDYNKSILTTLLKDSFGGRAKTIMILCISSAKVNNKETYENLEFTEQVQLIKNFVTMNTFSDNNVKVSINRQITEDDVDHLNLPFSTTQWIKLISSAEGLFKNLMNSKSLTDQDREQIEEWMYLKTECEECIETNETNVKIKPLVPIPEDDENIEDDKLADKEVAELEKVIVPNLNEQDDDEEEEEDDDDDDDNEGEEDEDEEDEISDEFEAISDNIEVGEQITNLFSKFCNETDDLIKNKYDEFKKENPKPIFDSVENEKIINPVEVSNKNSNERRRSLQPGSSLSSVEIEMLNKVANNEIKNVDVDCFLDKAIDLNEIRANKTKDDIKMKLLKIDADIDASKRQIKEIEHTISLKKKLIAELIKNNDTRRTAKQRFNKKKNKVESEYEKAKKALSKAVINNHGKNEIERLKLIITQLEQRLQDLTSIKHIASENGQKVKNLQKSLQESQRQVESLQKSLKKNLKNKESLENELKEEKSKKKSNLSHGKKNICEVAARISHLDQVLKEKSETLEQFPDSGENESLRHEIRNLRRTRDHLVDQRCYLDKKLRKEKHLSQTEERKILECDEAIEAIDAAIEFKNELICGKKSIDTNEQLQREKGEKMLMARLNNLSTEEMRTLIYKYFQKVIDLKESSRKLELNLIELERERDAWEWRERVLTNAVRQARLEGERHAVLLQRQHETKLTLMLRHLADENSVNSSVNDKFLPSSSLASSDQDLELDIYRPGTSKHEMDLYTMPVHKCKEKEHETKNKLFQKFQILTRYHGSDKRKCPVSIPTENLKQLHISSLPKTKVTREKNKLIIQQNP